MTSDGEARPRDGRKRDHAVLLLLQSVSLGRRLAGVYALVALLLVLAAAAVFLHVDSMRRDADRLLEETREQVVMARIVDDVSGLSALLESGGASSLEAAEVAHYREQLEELLDELVEFFEREDDPSRPRHQFEERRIAEGVLDDVRTLQGLLGNGGLEAGRDELLATVGRVDHFSAVLYEETREEAEHADDDLQQRARTTIRVLSWTVLAVIAMLCGSVYLVYKTVVKPLGSLREGAERFGRGELDHRIRVGNRDEIGVLARSMNTMAGRLAGAQTALETEVEARTRDFVRAARLADLGVFAAGVAHEINTPLASILSSAEGLQRKVDRGEACEETQREYLRTIASEAHRAREITSRLLALSRHDQAASGPVDVGFVLEQVRSATSHALRKNGVELETEILGSDLRLEGHAGELVQVLVNLVVNARDASPRGATIELRARDALDQVVFEVADNGRGIAPEDLDRVFDPFYTTKPPGEGTGLGLALVSALVSSRGGRIHAESAPGRGTTFVVELPKRQPRPGDHGHPAA